MPGGDTPGGGTVKFSDVAYVTTKNIEGRERQILKVLLTSGNGCFAEPAQPDTGPSVLVVGDQPSLIATGTLMGDRHLDIAIIDTVVDQFNRSAKLRVFFGDGQGHFKPGPGVSVFPLQEGQTPVAIATGRFRGATMPVDIAIASVPSGPNTTGGSQVTLLLNNGHGEFGAASTPIPLGNLRPAAMLASDGFRGDSSSEKRLDLVIKESVPSASGRNRLLYLKNAGNGTFPDIVDITAPDGTAGNNGALLTGLLQHNTTAGDKLDIVTFDDDLTLRIFKNDGLGGFNKQDAVHMTLNNRSYGFAFDRDGLADVAPLGSTLRLLGAVVQDDGQKGMLMIEANGSGGFVPRFQRFNDRLPPQDPGGPPITNSTRSESPHPLIMSPIISASLVGQFLDPNRNQKPGLALSAYLVQSEVKAGPCPVPASPVPPGALRPLTFLVLPPDHSCIAPAPACIDGLTQCMDPPINGRCRCRCLPDPPPPPPPPPPPLPLVCATKAVFPRQLLIVIANPFQ
jgi:hypothetical protein